MSAGQFEIIEKCKQTDAVAELMDNEYVKTAKLNKL